MATLSGNKIKDTYQSLVKFSDNGNITTSAKQLTDGFGNNSPMFVSTTQVGIGVTPEAGLNLHVFGDAKIGSNLTVIGNLVVEGSTTTVGTDTLTVKDPLIVLANNNTSTDAVDIGFYGKYTPSGTTLYSGLFREALTGKYRLFKGLEDEPTTTVNTSGTGYAVATLVGDLEGTLTGVIASTTTATTQSANDNSTKVATTAYVDNQVGLYDTLSEVLANGNTTGGTDIAITAGDDITFTSSSKLIFTGGVGIVNTALEMYHDGTDGYIDNINGELILQNNSDDKKIIFKSDNGIGDITEYFRIDGNINRNVITVTTQLNDDVPLIFGDGAGRPSIKYDSTATDLIVSTNGSTALTIDTSQNATFSADLIVDTDTLFVDSTNSQIGINNASPSGFTGQYSKDLIIGDGTGDRGITIYSSSSAYGSLFFKDAEGSSTGNGGFIAYNHFVDGMEFGIGNAGLGAGSLSIGSSSIFMRKKLIVDATYSTTNTLTVNPSNARVGIFNDSPSYRLDVAGDARFTGQTIIGSDLTVDTDTLFVDASEDSVGIGLTNPSDYTADELVISVPDESGMTLVSGTTDAAYIAFANATSQLNNYIGFDHDTDTMSINNFGGDINFSVGEAINKMTINSSGITFDDEIISNSYATIQSHINIDSTVAGDPYISFQQDGTQRASISYDDTEEAFRISTDEFFIKTGSPRVKALTVDSSQNVGIGTAGAPLAKLDVRDDIRVGASTSTTYDNNLPAHGGILIKSSGTQSRTAYIYQDDTTVSAGVGGLFIESSHGDTVINAGFASVSNILLNPSVAGNVGIGTTSPSKKLEVATTGINQSTTVRIQGTDGNGAGHPLDLKMDGAADSFSILIGQGGGATPSTVLFNGNRNGNVGIGTTSPSSYDADSDNLVVFDTANAGITIATSDLTGKSSIRFSDGTTGSRPYIGGIEYLHSDNSMRFDIAAVERMRIDSSGVVQIKNDLPRLQLYNTDIGLVLDQVIGTIDFYKSDASGSGVGVSSSIQVRSDSSIGANSYMAFHTDGGSGLQNLERMRIDSSGKSTFYSNEIEVYASSSSASLILNSGDATKDEWTIVTTDLAGDAYLRFVDTTTATTAMSLRDNGNVGIGTDDPDNQLHIASTGTPVINLERVDDLLGAGNVISVLRSTSLTNKIISQISTECDLNYTSKGRLMFYTNDGTNPVERMRITSGGTVSNTGTTILGGGAAEGVTGWNLDSSGTIITSSDSDSNMYIGKVSGYSNDRFISFYVNGSLVGRITTNGSTTSYVTTSDYRAKENVVKMTNALDRVSQLKPSRFNFIADADKTVDGFLAHEVQEIVPEAISGEKDAIRTEEYEVSPAVYEDVVHPAEEAVYETVEHPAVEQELDDEGNVVVEAVEAYTEEVLVTEAKEEWTEKVLVTEKVMGTREVPDYQGIDQSKLVPLLVGAIQEQQQLINDLKNRIETLENN